MVLSFWNEAVLLYLKRIECFSKGSREQDKAELQKMLKEPPPHDSSLLRWQWKRYFPLSVPRAGDSKQC